MLVGDPSVTAVGLVSISIRWCGCSSCAGPLCCGESTPSFVYAVMRPYTDGDLVRMVATGTMIVLVCYVAAWLAPLIVEMTDRAGAGLAEGSVFTVALAGDS